MAFVCALIPGVGMLFSCRSRLGTRSEGLACGGPNISRLQPPTATLRLRLLTLEPVGFFQSLRNPYKSPFDADQTAEKTTKHKSNKRESKFHSYCPCDGLRKRGIVDLARNHFLS